MTETKKLTASQKGIMLQELLSFLLSMNGKAKGDDVFEYLLRKSSKLNLALQEKEYIEEIELLALMCVEAEWMKKDSFWRVTEHGERAYERFKSSKVLFQEMAIQFVVRNEENRPTRKGKSRIGLFIVGLLVSPCTLIGFLSSSRHLVYLAIVAIFLLFTALVLYNSRTKLLVLWRILMIEFLILCGTLILDVLFATTSLQNYFQTFFFASLVIQVSCIMLVFLFPRFFSKVFEYINRNTLLMIIPALLFMLAFGGRHGRGGLLKAFYGDNIATIGFTTVFAVLTGVGLIYILGGMISGLVRVGYYD